MADRDTHKRIADQNERTMSRLLNPNTTSGMPSPHDHPWVVVMAYYTAYHLIEEVASIVNPDSHLSAHDEQIEFLRKTPALREVAFLYNNLNTLRRYALYRLPANVSLKSEQRILCYADSDQFRSIVLGNWFGTIKDKLTTYSKSLMSIRCLPLQDNAKDE
jgi:hypothetical protein